MKLIYSRVDLNLVSPDTKFSTKGSLFGPVNIVFTGLYVWVVPVTSGKLYCTNYLSTGNRYRLYISLKTISYYPGFARSMYIVYYETENHSNSKVHAIVRMANFKVYVIWYQRASMRKLASIAF